MLLRIASHGAVGHRTFQIIIHLITNIEQMFDMDFLTQYSKHLRKR